MTKLDVAGYLAGLMENCIRKRLDDGPRKYIVATGVPQGSALEPLSWNIRYDGVFVFH